ncbi:MAG: alpha-amylase family glycosyl hydrolase [Kofleriaceae bacterium]
MIRVLDPRGTLVTVHAGGPSALELYGELPCWQQPLAMQRVASGWQAELRVSPGVYAIKARVPRGAWLIDPSWRTMTSDGEPNGALVVGGTIEPVLHAPVAPWLVALDDGRVIVRAALRRSTGDRLAVCADDVTRAMRPVRADATHLWFEAELAGATRELEYRFVLPGGRALEALRAAPRPAPLPMWWRDAVVYTVFVDRFRGWHDATAWQRELRAGGDLDGVRDALPYLAELGVTVLHLTPVCIAPSVHRYDAIDPRAVDPALGGEAAFDRLLAAAGARGLRIVVDVATTHVHREFAPFRDVAARGEASPYWRWFRAYRWPFVAGGDPGYVHYQHGQWEEPMLALDEPEVQDEIVDWATGWIRRGANGVRIDAAADLPLPLLARIRAEVRAADAEAIVFGEVVPASLDRFVPGALDAATDFAHREALAGWLAGELPAARVEDVAAAQRARGAASGHALGFTGTHDQPRIATVTGDLALARLGLVLTALGARVPLLYYGDEVGLASTDKRAFEDSWPDRQPMPWEPMQWQTETRDLVRAALALRRTHDVLVRGDEDVVAHGDEIVHLRRRRLSDAIDVVVHRGTGDAAVVLPPGPAHVLLTCGEAALDGVTVRLGPRSAIVVDRCLHVDPVLRVHNAELAGEAFVAGRLECPAYPVRLYLTVTERCNLRCQHCITDAPARTRSGRARELQPWLLDALGEAFAHADYIAFTHGGESLTSPRFTDVLRRIAAAPGHREVHLISNGMLLDEDRVAELAELGVTSLMVSLDGATAATNDRIRVLGKLDRVVANLRAAIALRDRRGLDLRIGISTVAGASNVAELPALGRLARELGVDWLKLEETYPATPFARRDLLAPEGPELAAAMAALRDVLAGSSLVLVDHLAPPEGCTCAGDPATVAFRAADDFANRATFRPCRAAWEQIAIDPDGSVHAVDYAGPVLGNLLDASLLALWNTPPAQALRDRAIAATTELQRRRCVG